MVNRWLSAVVTRLGWKQSVSVAAPQPRVPDPIEIDLSDLAKNLWLPLNVDFMRIEVAPEEGQANDRAMEAESDAAQPGDTPEAKESASSDMPPDQSRSVSQPLRPEGLQSSVLVRDLLVPYQAILEAQRVWVPILEMVKVLEQYGHCPSVVVTAPEKDEEHSDLYSIRDTLAKVTLKEHTHRVTLLAMKSLKETYRDYEPLVPKMLVAALGHDLGKIPVFRASGIYTMGDHPAVSAMKVQELFAGSDIPWLRESLDAIRGHHRASKDQFDALLRQADGRARELEVAAFSKELKVQPWESWFSVPRLLELMEPKINQLQRGGRWSAISIKDTVYAHPDLLLDAARRLSAERKVVDLSLIRLSDREKALRRIVDEVRRADVLAVPIGEGFYGRSYQIIMNNPRRRNTLPPRNYFVPIKLEVFNVLASDLEARKSGILQIVVELRAIS
jgi:hypothetical protein